MNRIDDDLEAVKKYMAFRSTVVPEGYDIPIHDIDGGSAGHIRLEPDNVQGLVVEIERLRSIIRQAYKQTVELGQNVVVGPQSPRRFPISDLLEVLGAASPDIRLEKDEK